MTGRTYYYETNELEAERTLRADVFVFAMHTCQDPAQYDVLDLASWEFYVVPVTALQAAGSLRSVTKGWLDRHEFERVGFEELSPAIAAVTSQRNG